jgi:hypothetical protein
MQNPGATAVVYSIYVIEISDERGPRLNPKYPNVYVGQTALTPEERFAQHQVGYKASRYLWKGGKGRGQWLGLWLKRGLYEQYNPIETRAEAERLEVWLAEQLRHQGYAVFVG